MASELTHLKQTRGNCGDGPSQLFSPTPLNDMNCVRDEAHANTYAASHGQRRIFCCGKMWMYYVTAASERFPFVCCVYKIAFFFFFLAPPSTINTEISQLQKYSDPRMIRLRTWIWFYPILFGALDQKSLWTTICRSLHGCYVRFPFRFWLGH